MRKLLLRSCLLFLLTLSLAGQTSNWKKYDNKDGNFTVWFPGEPQDSLNGDQSAVKSHTLLARDGRAIFTVIYTVHSDPQVVDDATYQVFKKAVFKELPKCETEAEQAPAPAINGYIGHWYKLNCDMPGKVFVEGNLYWGRNYAYAVMAMYPGSVERPPMEQQFLESFSVPLAAN